MVVFLPVSFPPACLPDVFAVFFSFWGGLYGFLFKCVLSVSRGSFVFWIFGYLWGIVAACFFCCCMSAVLILWAFAIGFSGSHIARHLCSISCRLSRFVFFSVSLLSSRVWLPSFMVLFPRFRSLCFIAPLVVGGPDCLPVCACLSFWVDSSNASA